MTLEEKLTYMQTVSMEQARAEGNAIIDAHREALEKIFSDHKSEMMRQAETRIKAETTNAKRTVSQALAKSQLEIKRSQGKVQQELKDKVFEEAMQLVNDYMKTKAYDDFLLSVSERQSGLQAMTRSLFILNPSDEKKRTELEKETGAKLTVSAEDFIGGVRAVIRSRNILMDHSFKTQIQDEYDKFLFLGGDGIA